MPQPTRGPRLLTAAIVADDLSGAADCAAAFHRAGLSTSVGLDAQVLTSSNSDVVAFSTETRDESPSLASALTTQAFLAVKKLSPLCTFKKIDSTLRGHLGLELQAALSANSTALAVVAPSFPSHGRTMVAGQLLVHGKPVDHHWMVGESSLTDAAHLVDYLRECGLSVESAQLRDVRSENLPSLMLETPLNADVLVCDAELEDDLDLIASAGLATKRELLWVGSAGLGFHVAHQLSLLPSKDHDEPPVRQSWSRAEKPVVVVVGSANRQSHLQVDNLAEFCPVVFLSSDVLLDANDSRRLNASDTLGSLLQGGDNFALAIEQDHEESDPRAFTHVLARALGKLISDHLADIGGFVLTGGQTARSVLEACGTRSLEVCGEVEAGVPVLRSYELDIPVITKAGAFGDVQTLSRCLDAIEPRK